MVSSGMLRCVALVRTDISEELSASFIRVTRIGELRTTLCSSVQYCKILIFADDAKIFRVINSPRDCLLLQSDINSVNDWCIANSMRLILLRHV
jgi:hypothetical protein